MFMMIANINKYLRSSKQILVKVDILSIRKSMTTIVTMTMLFQLTRFLDLVISIEK